MIEKDYNSLKYKIKILNFEKKFYFLSKIFKNNKNYKEKILY